MRDVVERLEEQDARKEAEKKSKQKKRTKRMEHVLQHQMMILMMYVACEQCGQAYTEEEIDSWIGCDNCESW